MVLLSHLYVFLITQWCHQLRLAMGTPASAQLVEWAESFRTALQRWGPLTRNRHAASTAEWGRKVRGAGRKNPSRFVPFFKLSGYSMAGAVGDLCCTSPALAPRHPPLLLSAWIWQHHDAIAAAAQIRRERHRALTGKATVVLKARKTLAYLYIMISV